MPRKKTGLRLAELTPTPAKASAFVRTLLFAHRAWLAAEARRQPVRPISLTRLYSTAHRRDRDAVVAALSVFFERVSRGNNAPGSACASIWRRRPEPTMRLDSPRFRLLLALFEANEEVFEATTAVVYSKKDDHPLAVKRLRVTSLVVPAEHRAAFDAEILPVLRDLALT
jgi:hypothetical protein